MAFTPRTKQTIKISRPDGTSVNLAEAAAAAKGPSSVSSSGVATPDVAVAEEAPKKKMPSLPVIVRLESEEQKKTRLAEEEKRRKIKEEEAKEEQERKDRLERRAKEEEDRKTKEEEERKAKEDEDKKAKEKEEADKVSGDPLRRSSSTNIQVEKASEEATVKAEASPAVASPAAVQTDESEPSTTVGDNAAPASEKVDETRRALLTPSSQSAAASPLQSPALAAAGLPAKPVSAINGARRPTPSALDVKSATQTSSAPSTPSALSSAKPIDDLDSVDYPSTVKPQRAELNANSSPGKFRYDRDFLMQFMEVCKDKPETLPSLEEIGLEADSSSGFGQGRRGGNRTSMPGTSRTGSGIGGSRSFPSGPAGGMGSFGFSGGASSYRNNATSEERYKHSLQNRVGSTMARTSSQGGSMFVPMGGSSRSGNNRSQRGGKRMPQERSASSAMDPDVAPLAVTANAWVNARSAPTDEKSPAFIERKVKSLLNKLTEEKFESISAQILEWANKSKEETDGMTLKLVIKLVFEKSTDESHWSAMYAKLCRLLLDRVDPQVSEVIDGKSVAGGSLFRKYLLGRCQADFEAGWKAREEAALLASAKSEEDKERLAKAEVEKEKEGGDTVMMSDEYYTAQKAKRRGLGLVQLIGELYKLEMLSKTVIRECLVRLLGNVENPDEEDLESTCKLLTTVGGQFEKASSQQLDVVFERLTSITANDNITSRIRFMIMVSLKSV
jgi:translation initiation factor 4G